MLRRHGLRITLTCALALPATSCLPVSFEATCRAKDGKIDLAWAASAGASHYRVFRSQNGGPETEVGDVAGLAFADAGLVNGTAYRYVVVARNAQGLASADSNPVSCTPAPRGGAPPPPPVASLTCRGKNDKVDVTWTPVQGATLYRVFRAQGTGAPVLAGEVAGNVLVDFGLTVGATYRYTVASVAASGAAAEPSPACDVTPRGRSSGNRPPSFTSQPLTSAREFHYWYTQLAATDPDGDAVTFSLVAGPLRMATSPEGFVAWTPETEQIGPNAVEVRATDARGAFASQAFVVDVADFNDPPTITSAPGRTAKARAPYRYDVKAFDPEGKTLVFSFGAPAPAGMAIDGTSGLVTWTPSAGDTGVKEIVVRASDPDGGFDVQTYALDVYDGSVDILSPKGAFEVAAGSTLELPLQSNQAAAVFSASPLPDGTTASPQKLVFTPPVSAVGEYAIAVQARMGDEIDVETITVRVIKDNHAPVITAPREQTVDEGQEIAIPVSATDADGDLVVLTTPGLALENGLFDAMQGRLFFRPSFEQAGVHEVLVAATDGSATTTATISIVVNEKSPPSRTIDLVVDPVPGPTFQPTARISGNVVGDPSGPPEPQPFVAITALSPVSIRQGRSIEVTITGLNTQFAPNQAVASFGEGITVESLEVLSPTQAKAKIHAEPSASTGLRTVRVSGSGFEAASVVAFSVEAGASVFSGELIDSFTQQPIANARVVVNGTGIEAVTDAEGKFRLEGVPAGAQQVVVAVGNYKVRTLDLSFDPNADVAFPDPVSLDALARPFQAGGSLPRASNLASVLDRGVAGGDQAITQEQAEALVRDTLVTLGGSLVGVYDEAGNQLNPKLSGPGLMSLTPAGVTAHARGLLDGGRFTVREIAFLLTNAFEWTGTEPDTNELVSTLQRFADDAWKNPSDPLNAMAFVLLNRGTSLASRAPVVTPDTSFNRFQTFLLVSGLLLPSLHSLDAALDASLRAQGVNPDDFAARGERIGVDLAHVRARALLDVAEEALAFGAGLVVAPANADSGGVVIPPPNDYFSNGNPFRTQTFSRMSKYAILNFAANATVSNLVGALTVAAIQGCVAILAGAGAGVAGVTAGGALAISLLDGVMNAVWRKLVVGLITAGAASSIEPAPPLPEGSFTDEETQKLFIEFEPSVNEANPPGDGLGKVLATFARYSYELFQFPTPFDTDVRNGIPVRQAELTVSPRNPKKYAFSLPAGALSPGVYYFRIATIQYQTKAHFGLNQARRLFQYDTQLGAEDIALASPTDLLKGSYRLDEGEALVVKQTAKSNFAANSQAVLAEFDFDQERKAFYTAEAYNSEISAVRREATFKEQLFTQQNGRNVARADSLLGTAVQHGKSGGKATDWLDSNSSVVGLAESRVNKLPTDTIPPAVQSRLVDASDAADKITLADVEISAREGALEKLGSIETLRREAQIAGKPDITASYFTLDEAGRPQTVTRTIPANETGFNELRQLMEGERASIRNAQATMASNQERLRGVADDVFDGFVGSKRESYERGASQDAERLRTLEIDRDAKLQEIKAKKLSPTDIQTRANAREAKSISGKLEPYKPVLKGGLALMKGLGDFDDAKLAYEDLINSLKLEFSQFSPCFMYTHNPRNVPPYSIEPHPDFGNGGIVVGEKGRRRTVNGVVVDQSKTGWLTETHFDEPTVDRMNETGFPPEFLSVDEAGRIYAVNGNSSARFGGRVFRFFPAEGFRREYVGQVNYYSAMLQYARPASPLAMTAGKVFEEGRVKETLFIADVDLTDPGSGAVQAGKPILKQLPIGRIGENGSYVSEADRNRLVAQPFAEDPRFEFTGPTDLAAESDGAYSRVYVSDNANLFVVRQNLGSGATEVIPLISAAGRRWGGLAFDSDLVPNFYFTDYETGDVFYATQQALRETESQPGSLMLRSRTLTQFRPRRAFDLEVEADQRWLVASTQDGPVRLRMPVVAKIPPNVLNVRLKSLGREYSAVRALDGNGDPLAILPVGEFEEYNGSMEVVVDIPGAEALGTSTVTLPFRLGLAGPTEIDLASRISGPPVETP